MTFWGQGKIFSAIFVTIAFAIVYPEKILNFLGERTGKDYSRRVHWIVSSIAAVAYALTTTIYLSMYPSRGWGIPLLLLCGILLLRGVKSALGADEE